MTIKPLSYKDIPSTNSVEFESFIKEWESKCNDLMFFSSKWPVVKRENAISVRKKSLSPGDTKQ
ncbi:hypothetical protein AX774_g3920, partial [Zancudomyces culisetae]